MSAFGGEADMESSTAPSANPDTAPQDIRQQQRARKSCDSTLDQGKLRLFFFLAVSRLRQPIAFPLPFEFYLQKISINRLYAVIPCHSLGLSPAWALFLPQRQVAYPR